jgi:hypothetical protein
MDFVMFKPVAARIISTGNISEARTVPYRELGEAAAGAQTGLRDLVLLPGFEVGQP